ncbi:MAG TPA: PEP/pyruvate-binding domain-containing protein [Verrucomicrobiae bacterium]|nr:PEP/pyruvate-binding domain-containing protein [Verrucomicrobiae bacterium]
MNYTFTFHESLATRLESSGGKGSNLALLTQQGFPVPPGFIVTAPAYRDFITGRRELLRAVSQLPFHDAGRLRAESGKLRDTLEQWALPGRVVEEIRTQLNRFPERQAFSVRSSSTMEDLAGAAFAGQHETYLNCSGAAQILARIKECFLSLWSDRAMAYRHQQGFDHALAAMAVVVQQMVPCEVAGVGFSINPISGDLNEMIVDANFGLGESVVSGEAEVDHFAIDRTTRAIRSAHIAEKSRKVVPVAGGTEVVPLGKDEGRRACLSDAQLAQLADLLLRIEAFYRFPQDIEWGIADGQLSLLQSRPITTIPPRWTRDESAERFPNVITPLTWDFVESGFHRSLNYSFQLMGFPPFHGKWFGSHGHYIYGNQNAVELYSRRAPFLVRNLEELRTAIPKLREEFRWVQELPVTWARDLDFYLISIGRSMTEPLSGKTLREVWDFVRSVNELGANYFLPNIAISITHSTLYRLLHHFLQMVFTPDAAGPLFDHLMAYCETKTGTINKELFELATLIRARPELEQIVNQHSSRDLISQNRLHAFPEFQARLQKFLRDHGHREVDFDAYSPTWLDLPWVVLDNLRLILQTPMEQDPAAKERELKIRAQRAELELFQKLPSDVHFVFAEILRLARVYTSLDDLEHYQTTRLTLPLRRGLQELGERLVKCGALAEPMDIFFAHSAQIDSAIAQDNHAGWKDFTAAIQHQKHDYLRDQARKPEWTLGETKTETTGGDCLSGLAGSPGQAEGPVFLVLGPDDFAKFPKGAVLVARTTNPTWTPLFYSAVAVVTESGGPLSHGAVTAREMRIPAVMSVKDSLSRLKNGTRVRVDGGQGKVYLIT